jgi:hypothetical protein
MWRGSNAKLGNPYGYGRRRASVFSGLKIDSSSWSKRWSSEINRLTGTCNISANKYPDDAKLRWSAFSGHLHELISPLAPASLSPPTHSASAQSVTGKRTKWALSGSDWTKCCSRVVGLRLNETRSIWGNCLCFRVRGEIGKWHLCKISSETPAHHNTKAVV